MKIVVGVDGSAASEKALRWAVAEGRLRNAPVTAVYAWEMPSGIGASGPLLGGPVVGLAGVDPDDLRRASHQRLVEAVANVPGTENVVLVTAEGHSAEVLVGQAETGDILVVGSRGHGGLAGALLGSVSHACAQHAACPVVIVRESHGGRQADAWHPDEVIARELAQNAHTWEALTKLGVKEGSSVALEFCFESGGPAGDDELAAWLRSTTDYVVTVETGGVTGHTQPMPVDPKALDVWVRSMVLVGHEHGGCAFDGWTATVSAGPAH